MINQPVNGGYLQKLSRVEESGGNEFTYQGIAITDVPSGNDSSSIGSLHTTTTEAIKSSIILTVNGLKSRMSALLEHPDNVVGLSKTTATFKVFNHDAWPEDDNALVNYGEAEIKTLLYWFSPLLIKNKCEAEEVLIQWNNLKTLVAKESQDKSYTGLWKTMLAKQPYKEDFKDLHLVHNLLVLPVSAVQCEQVFSAQNHVKLDVRSSLATETLEDLIRISADGPALKDFDPQNSAIKWTASSARPRKLKYKERPDELDTDEEEL